MNDATTTLEVAGGRHRIQSLARAGVPDDFPRTLRVLAENLLWGIERGTAEPAHLEALLARRTGAEIAFMPARVLMQDFTGVPAIVDLAAMRDAAAARGLSPESVRPGIPVELVIDHSVQVDAFGTPEALEENMAREYARNAERYRFLKWGQQAFEGLVIVPPGRGIVHQVNLERLARVVFAGRDGSAYFDTVVGTDSHTTMVNALGVLGWGVGGIEAEAAMLGQPIAMALPGVVGVELRGRPRPGVTATDIVLFVTERLRRHGVVGKFVEFFGEGAAALALPDRATIANMAPEYGATCGFFAIDDETLSYLALTGRDEETIARVRAHAKAQGLWGLGYDAAFDERVVIELADIRPSLAGPKRPQDRVELGGVPDSARAAIAAVHEAPRSAPLAGADAELADGAVVIAAITSCTNTSNPALLLAAGLLAGKARARGLAPRPWVKTSLAPGSRAVTNFLAEAGLLEPLAALGFAVVGYGCTTCIGNSGPLPGAVADAIRAHDLAVAAVLSGNRNFEGRVHPLVRLNYLASPPLVVAYALAGSVLVDLEREPLGTDASGRPVFLRELWPTSAEVAEALGRVRREHFTRAWAELLEGDARWQALDAPQGARYAWDEDSTYIRRAPFLEDARAPEEEIRDARALVVLGDSVTTDHISPAGAIPQDSPAGRYLLEHGVAPEDFNSYGARRGNHEVMMRGTFANIRLRNLLVPDAEGGVTLHLPDGARMSVFDAAMRYRDEGVPVIVIAGKEYGTGSSRDWAAKGPALLGVRAVIAESYERIHRSNLVGMGILPLEFLPGEGREALGLTGRERFTIRGVRRGADTVEVETDAGIRFTARVRIDTDREWDYYEAGGILPFVLAARAS